MYKTKVVEYIIVPNLSLSKKSVKITDTHKYHGMYVMDSNLQCGQFSNFQTRGP